MSLLLRRGLLGSLAATAGNAEVVLDQTYSARNFNTSPLTISGLTGDSYDYELVVVWSNVASGIPYIQIHLNSDTTANYRYYFMNGIASAASAYVSDTSTYIPLFWNVHSSADPLISKIRITGSSGDERYIEGQQTWSSAGTENYSKTSCYWKNTASEMTSMVITGSLSVTNDAHVMLYRTPKSGNQGTWKEVSTLSWSAETAEKSVTSLAGDSDGQYRIVWQGDQELNIELQNDNAANYARQYLQNTGASISAANSTTNTSIVTDGIEATVIINPASGVKRLCRSSGSNTSADQKAERAIWWNNTVDEITTIDCTPAASSTGTAKLYKRLSPTATGDTLNFTTIAGGNEDFSADDFSAGTTHTIAGDSMKMLKIEGLLSNASGDIEIRMQLNSDTAANYPEQLLKGDTSTASAASATRNYIVLGKIQQGDQAEFTHYLYTDSGENRVGLTECSYDENALEFLAQWWSNSADEITTVKIYASTSNGITGNIKVSELI